MSTSLRLAIVGCGGMGHRHLMGLVELQQQGLLTLDLVAACDPVAENAESLARLAQQELGAEPVPVPDLASLAAHGVQAIDITSPPGLHHHLIAEAADMGIHVMTEKPVGLTVASSLEICETARSHSDIVISVAENYRRDPINRLARAESAPWELTYSYGRGLQAAPQKAWAGKAENVEAAQEAFLSRCRLTAAARQGQYSASVAS